MSLPITLLPTAAASTNRNGMPLNFSRTTAIMIDPKELASATVKAANLHSLNGVETLNISTRDNQISPLPFEKADEETDCARILLNMHFFGTTDYCSLPRKMVSTPHSQSHSDKHSSDHSQSDEPSSPQDSADHPHNQLRYKQQGRWITVCDICGKHIKGKTGAMARHQTIHSKVKRYECNICHGKYSTIANLRRHQKTRHNDQLVYACRLCDERFLDEEWLSRHARLCESNHRKDLNVSTTSRHKSQKITA